MDEDSTAFTIFVIAVLGVMLGIAGKVLVATPPEDPTPDPADAPGPETESSGTEKAEVDDATVSKSEEAKDCRSCGGHSQTGKNCSFCGRPL